MTRFVLWDWNGTLLDDVNLCVDALNRLLQQHGYPQRYDIPRYREIFGFPIRDYYVRAGFDFSRDPFDALAAGYMAMYIPESAACPLMPGALQALALLRGAEVRQTILSASPLPTLERQVAERQIRPYFEELLGLSDIYAASKIALGQDFLRRSGLSPADTVMIGDSVHDFEVSRALGTGCVLYAGGHQSAALLAGTGAPVCATLAQACRAALGR